jgi:hypothetical protein
MATGTILKAIDVLRVVRVRELADYTIATSFCCFSPVTRASFAET